uniref:palmitoyl-protein hydrolase n=1 Tax=Hucho hucho TaxID=62062 RepID=A0A4W5J9Z2_9TELE
MAAVRRSKFLHKCVASPTGKDSASVIFIHGSGDTGQGVRAWVKEVSVPDLAFPHIRVVYPTALARPYTPMQGVLSNVWFDCYKISRDCLEHLGEVTAGVPKYRMIIGGFSMGGAMALHLACRYHRDVAGVFALSSFLNKDCSISGKGGSHWAVEERAGAGSPLPELLQGHGPGDELVFRKWGEETMALLKKAGMTTTFHSFPGLQHQLFRPEIELLRSWILTKLLPDSLDASGQ